MMGAVFAMQGFGQLTGALVALVTIVGFKGSLSSVKTIALCTGECALAVDKSWRVLIGM
jgi:PHS family inorganic phosphate transporter-like MFS transporter